MTSTETFQTYKIIFNDQSRDHTSPTLLQNLVLTSVPKPTPGPHSVLVRIRAAALNFRDLLVLARSPLYPAEPSSGLIPLADGAGEIVSVGIDSIWKTGDSVILCTNRDWEDGDVYGTMVSNSLGGGNVDGMLDEYDLVDDKWLVRKKNLTFEEANSLGSGKFDGTLAQYVVVEDKWLVRKPKNLTFEEAASLPAAGGTAMNVLSSIKVKKGTTVLTQGTGGVSCFVIQFAAALGARVITTSSTAEKLQIAKELGASDFINYKDTPDWATEVLRLTDGKGVALVNEVGGAGTIVESIKALQQGGIACLVGFLTPSEKNDLTVPLVVGSKTLKGILGNSKKMLQDVVELVEKHDVHPMIQVFEWEDAPKAYEALRNQNFVGKVVIKV